jgi:hypothetical protein
MSTMTIDKPNHAWIRRVGAIGFTFFLVKGLLWLAAPFVFWALA